MLSTPCSLCPSSPSLSTFTCYASYSLDKIGLWPPEDNYWTHLRILDIHGTISDVLTFLLDISPLTKMLQNHTTML